MSLWIKRLECFSAAGFQKCAYGDSACFTRVANEVISTGKTGNSALGLSVFDPLKVDRMTIQQKEGPVMLKIDLNNFQFKGLSGVRFSKVDGFRRDFEKAKIEMRFKFPEIHIEGPYKIEGRVLVLPVSGNGNCTMRFCEFLNK